MSDSESKSSDSAAKSLKIPRSPQSRENSGDRMADLKKQRGTMKARLTLFDKYFINLKDTELNSTDKAELKLRMQSIESLYQNFNQIQCEIERLSDQNQLEKQLEYREQFEEQYFRALAAAGGRLVDESMANSTCTRNTSSKLASVKLPEIKLPTFNGSYDQWLEFRNSYDTMIHERDDLDAIQKFHYLRSSLSGSALQVISALEFTAANYTHAWDLLTNRFHNSRLLIHNHVKSLFNTQSIQSESPSQIRKLIDTVNRNLRALKTIGEPVDQWDTLIIYLIVTKLDPTTEKEWESQKGSIRSDQPSSSSLKLSDLLLFLKNKADTLELITVSHNKNKSLQEHKSSHGNNHFDAKKYAVHKPNQQVHSYVSNTQSKSEKTIRSCAMCQSNHALYTCVLFLNLPVNDRVKFVENKNLCPNCLRSGHSISDCTYGSCKLCHHKHNGLLHNQANSSSSLSVVRANSSSPADNNNIPTISAALHSQSEPNSRENRCDIGLHTKLRGLQPTLLSTALIEVADVNNEYHLARALLDSGSQHSFITEKLSKKLKLPLIQSTVRISGVGQHVTNSSQLCEIAMRSKSCSYNTMLQCLVLPCITSNLPSVGIDVDSLCMPENIQLADPTFNIPSEIDLLIGADRFWELLEGERIRLQSGPYLQNSKLGWFISGRIDNTNLSNKQQVHCHFTSTIDNDSLDMQMRKFWEIEEVPITKKLTADELKCEELFCTTTTRDETGRFCVRIPLKESADALGDSYSTARSRFMSLERKLQRSPEYKQMYCDFMNEYESLGHMTRIGIDKPELPNYTLSHHGVFKESSSTTRLRVVFNASVPTKSSKSLNDIQYSGPALQNDIFSILLRFRQYKYVVCADIEKMYRQVLIQPDQRSLQLIVWRDSPEDPLGVYQLNTVTYGTASAAYLSMRCLRQLASECGDDVIARVINEDFLVDDLITGCDDYQQLHSICEKTYQVLEAAGFILRKWTFNSKFSENSSTEMFMGEHTQSKTLGLGWLNTTDELHFTTKVENAPRLTKRVMLSIISQIYDPLGLLAPAVIISKILIQKLWLCKIDWEDAVPDSIVKTWNSFIQTLSTLVELRVPRYVRSEHTQHTELHIFSDASQDAYGSCAYIRSYDDLSEVTVKLLCAKSKVAPLKGLSIPRLELCGALVGARLCHKIVNVLRLKFDRIYCWTDSTIVIGWLRMSPHLLKQFVQNRVNEINELTGDLTWLHVNGLQNPADLLSRGLNLSELSQSSRWWHGPLFLKENNLNFSQHLPNELPELPELKTQTTSLICTVDNVFDFERYSTLNRMKRVVAYVLRFISNTRPQRGQKTTGPLSVDEITAAERALIIIAQKQMFPEEYHNLENNLPISNKKGCSITGLNVFLDKFKIIRVGGRLSNATEFDYNKKHPVLLCSKHRFTLLLVRDEHIRLLHAGPQLLLATVRECYWPLGGRNLARQVVRRCVICSRLKGNTLTPIMGDLPSERLHPGYPFMYCGVDYAGPVSILNRKGRGGSLVKGYICLFVCFVTRAIHLELVSGLSTKDYILALKRFYSRRGKPKSIFSDNAGNFTGVEKEISLAIKNNSQEIIDFAANEQIQFRFIVPRSPHSGGLWESGVKSCKHHLRRITGDSKLTFEEFTTVLSLIEAVLNSRPLSPLSADPNDLLPLTPAHFLIGRPLTAPASADLTGAAPHRLLRYDRVEQMRQHFWRRWSKEYVSELQIRSKWKTREQDLQTDMMVLIKEDNTPPLRWRLGRIVRTYPGKDGVSRVADIRTARGIIQRTFAKICPLPMQADEDTSGGADSTTSTVTPRHG